MSADPPRPSIVAPADHSSDDVDAAARAVEAMRALNLSLHRFRHQIATDVDVNVMDTIAMSALAAHGPLSLGDLANRVSLAPSSITILVDRLERRGFVQRAPRPRNRRSIDVRLTEAGTRTLNAAFAFARTRFADLNVDDLQAFVRVANGVATSLQALSSDLRIDPASRI